MPAGQDQFRLAGIARVRRRRVPGRFRRAGPGVWGGGIRSGGNRRRAAYGHRVGLRGRCRFGCHRGGNRQRRIEQCGVVALQAGLTVRDQGKLEDRVVDRVPAAQVQPEDTARLFEAQFDRGRRGKTRLRGAEVKAVGCDIGRCVQHRNAGMQGLAEARMQRQIAQSQCRGRTERPESQQQAGERALHEMDD